MQYAIEGGQLYQTLLDPPPADPRVAHLPKIRQKTGVKGESKNVEGDTAANTSENHARICLFDN